MPPKKVYYDADITALIDKLRDFARTYPEPHFPNFHGVLTGAADAIEQLRDENDARVTRLQRDLDEARAQARGYDCD